VDGSSDIVDDSNGNQNIKIVIWTMIKNDEMIDDILFN
jgi:myo-inositol-hexaphosphate 3-phosphohydrolase